MSNIRSASSANFFPSIESISPKEGAFLFRALAYPGFAGSQTCLSMIPNELYKDSFLCSIYVVLCHIHGHSIA